MPFHPARAGCLDTVAKRKRADMGRPKRINVAGERVISRGQFDILGHHGVAPVGHNKGMKSFHLR
jgi:hypothetical protein